MKRPVELSREYEIELRSAKGALRALCALCALGGNC